MTDEEIEIIKAYNVRERIKQRNHEYYLKNYLRYKEKYCKNSAEWKKNNPEKVAHMCNSYYFRNIDAIKERRRIRYMEKKAKEGHTVIARKKQPTKKKSLSQRKIEKRQKINAEIDAKADAFRLKLGIMKSENE